MRTFLARVKYLKLKFFVYSLVLLSVYLFILYIILMEVKATSKHESVKTLVVLPYVVVHLDFKGSPPKLQYLESLLPKLKHLGVNGLLMEYEDMFPYMGQLDNISARNCYTKFELSNFLTKAVNLGYEIIPLIQTFGHMEHVLKLKEFQGLREIPMYPDSICPSKTQSTNILRQMLEQVIKFHNDIFQLNYIHIGCDEVYHINTCYKCTKRGLSNADIYFNHLNTITNIVSNFSPKTKVLIWDDMLRGIKPVKWNKIGHLNNIQPVYWNYQSSQIISHVDLMNYHKKFDDIWIATAFKGADGRTALIPNMKNRFFNHYNWLKFIADYKFGGENEVYSFKGIILTGWSRYSHMDPSCELLPVSIPSLISNLLLIRKFKDGVIISNDDIASDFDNLLKRFLGNELNTALNCEDVTVIKDDYTFCNFEGNDVYDLLKQYDAMRKNIEEIFYNDQSELSSIKYYSQSSYINMNNVEFHIKWCDNNIKKILQFERKLYKTLSKYYGIHFTEEYINSKTYPIKKKLNNVMNIFVAYSKNITWDRRPVTAANNISLISN